MPIHRWPTQERPREKLLTQGASALSDAELLAIFLRTGRPGLSALDLARELLLQFGGLRGLLSADQTSLCAHAGLGPAKFAQLQAARALACRELKDTLQRGEALQHPEAARRLLHHHLRHRPQEVFCCLWLDNRHRLIAMQDLFHGSINSASVHPREVVRHALQHNAAAVILAHNHPSGVAEPSEPDKALTRRLQAALELIEVRTLDHIVVGDAECCSFAEMGLL